MYHPLRVVNMQPGSPGMHKYFDRNEFRREADQ